MGILQIHQGGVQLRFNHRADFIVFRKETLDIIAAFDFVCKELLWDVEGVPLCLLHPGLASGYYVDRNRDDVVSQGEATTRWHLDLSYSADECRH